MCVLLLFNLTSPFLFIALNYLATFVTSKNSEKEVKQSSCPDPRSAEKSHDFSALVSDHHDWIGASVNNCFKIASPALVATL